MSNVYVNEPVTSGKVCLKTTVGDIDIELWAKECPLACRNFVQLCMEGYYNGTVFHRLVKDFIVQGGDPDGTGRGGQSIYPRPFKDEFHQRLKFNRRGLVGMANDGQNSNGSQFFFTLAEAPELDKKHTLFAKVVGDTVFNMLRLGEGGTDADERPLSVHKIISAEILNNPFPDIIPREKVKSKKKDKKKEKKPEMKRDLGLLSFGNEAEEDEEELEAASMRFKTKSKSAHDILSDEKLSKEPAVRPEELQSTNVIMDDEEDKERINRIRAKLMKRKMKAEDKEENEDEEDIEKIISEEVREKQKRKIEELASERKALQKSYKKTLKKLEEKKEDDTEKEPDTEGMKLYHDLRLKFKDKSKNVVKQRDPERENQTLSMLDKFKSKLVEWSQAPMENPQEKDHPEMEEAATAGGSEEKKEDVEQASKMDLDAEDIQDQTWLTRKFEVPAQQRKVRQAKDANLREESEEWYDLTDPRNKMNRRRRGEEC